MRLVMVRVEDACMDWRRADYRKGFSSTWPRVTVACPRMVSTDVNG